MSFLRMQERTKTEAQVILSTLNSEKVWILLTKVSKIRNDTKMLRILLKGGCFGYFGRGVYCGGFPIIWAFAWKGHRFKQRSWLLPHPSSLRDSVPIISRCLRRIRIFIQWEIRNFWCRPNAFFPFFFFHFWIFFRWLSCGFSDAENLDSGVKRTVPRISNSKSRS